MTTALPISWARCGQGATPGDPFAGCCGITVTASGRCLAHADAAEQAAYLATLSPGADLDLRGTTVSEALLGRVVARLTDPIAGHPIVGEANFTSATFTGNASFASATFTANVSFASATFTGIAWFEAATFTGIAFFESSTFTQAAGFRSATFTGNVNFTSATFTGDVWFQSTTFTGDASFASATFSGTAWFASATFAGRVSFPSAAFADTAKFTSVTFADTAWFRSATFADTAWFRSTTFTRGAWFGSATFNGYADFGSATFTRTPDFESATFTTHLGLTSVVFENAVVLGPLVCAGAVDLSGARFGVAVTVEVAATEVLFRRTRWEQPATVWLRYAQADLSDAVAEYPVTVADRSRRFTDSQGRPVDESVLAGVPRGRARVSSLRGVDAAQMVLTDLDLTGCLFAGTVHLDQLRVEGDCRFSETPQGVHRRGGLPIRYTRRVTLAEEQHWRHARPRAVPGWTALPAGADIVQPRALAAVYRALRKSHEDSSNEPGAADFYYGEMEMRRADARTPSAERWLLRAYWALSGYGLRATRALVWLLGAVTLTMLVMMLWGLPKDDTPSLSTGTLTGRHITMTTSSPDPQNPSGPYNNRLTTDRFEKSLRVVVNSVVFHSSGQDLTTTGTYTEMLSRLAEPVLLGLAVLAVRGRIKR